MKESMLSLKEKNTTSVFLLLNCPQVLTIFYVYPVNYFLGRFHYTIPILKDQLLAKKELCMCKMFIYPSIL